MIVLFLLDDGSYKAVTPETLQLRQLEPGKVALGVPMGEEEGLARFLPFITYPINIIPVSNNTIDYPPTQDAEVK